MGTENSEQETEEFKPRGAIAFFLVLLVFFIAVWFTLYFQLLGRA
jgi:hypothetical protein